MFLGKLKRSKIKTVSTIAKRIERRFFWGNAYFVSNAHIAVATSKWAEEIAAEEFDIIIGVPRSGMMIASMLSLKLGKPLSTPSSFCNDEIWASKKINIGKIEKVFVVDDTASTGDTMKEVVKLIKDKHPKLEVKSGALFVSKTGRQWVDMYYEVMPEPMQGEWNLMHQKLGPIGFDMDGVLCEDCPAGADNNEEKYLFFIKNAKPLYIPVFEIDYIITSRLEKYRGETEVWLKNHGVKYKTLIMWNLKDKSMRNINAGVYKSREISNLDIEYFVESRLDEAEIIWNKTKVPTVCIEKMIMFNERYTKKTFNEEVK